MHVVKVISGLLCLVTVLLVGPFAWICFSQGELWFKFVPIVFMLALVAVGLILIRRRAMSRKAKMLLVLFVVFLILSPALLVTKIRHDRWSLQARAKAFLSRPMPIALKPDSEGYMGDEYVGTNGEADVHILGSSRALIERYATKGRIRWSARIQGQFATTSEHLWFPGADDIERTDEEVRAYLAERNAILSDEWRMGFWQWVEDTIEMKSKIPEHEEEDRDDRYVRQLDGTWTNESSDAMTISPNGCFSARFCSRDRTNIYGGNWVCRVRDPALLLFPTNASGTDPRWPAGEEKVLRIIHVDEHNLVYDVDSHTNLMKR